MVNEPEKLAGAARIRKDESAAGRFVAQKGGEEEENYEELMSKYGARRFAEGEVMKGTVLKITGTDVIVEVDPRAAQHLLAGLAGSPTCR